MIKAKGGFTLVELLTVLGIVGVLLGVLIPSLSAVRRRARVLKNVHQQRQVVMAANLFAAEHEERYPDSVAIIRYADDQWHWQDPRMMTACRPKPHRQCRSISAYLRTYLPGADVLFCPCAPTQYEYMQDAWDQGDQWDHPTTDFGNDPVYGTYGFYWNYVGFLSDVDKSFVGPRTTLGGRRQSTLLISDYFGFDHYSLPGAFGSCEPFKDADVVPGTDVSSDYWASPVSGAALRRLQPVQWHAGFTDGHVAGFHMTDTVPMEVAIKPDGSESYPRGVALTPGVFFIPRAALH